MRKIKVGILTLSDGREHIHQSTKDMTLGYQHTLQATLEATGLFEVIAGSAPICSNTSAKQEAQRLRQAGVDVTVFNYAIWCYPQFTAVAAGIAPGPFLLFCNLHPSKCGMVGMLAAAGALDQLGIPYGRVWGDINDPSVLQKTLCFLRAASAINRLKGSTYGSFGGRALGMYTTVSNRDQWQKLFGIDVEDMEQEDIIRAGNQAVNAEVKLAFDWLTANVGQIAYDGAALTPEKLETQIRSYIGLRTIIAQKGLDFVGVKAHGDLTEHYVTMDIAEAFLNDPYDWNGPKEPVIAATESDMDGALTMQVAKLMLDQPVLFADVRHYDPDAGVWYLSNSGTHATYFAAASRDPSENLKLVTFYPEVADYPAGGASVHHFAAPGEMTFARLARKQGAYHLTLAAGELLQFPREQMLKMGATTTPAWPVAFARLQASADEFLQSYPCNHIHGTYGHHIEAWKTWARLMNIQVTQL